jgi:hypothetical protein
MLVFQAAIVLDTIILCHNIDHRIRLLPQVAKEIVHAGKMYPLVA